ncbi:MAG: hypothetical protein JWL76_2002 [Thermoleophilia bacterium]|nr:hypothetical protein [Thermoleophilia bacterium]
MSERHTPTNTTPLEESPCPHGKVPDLLHISRPKWLREKHGHLAARIRIRELEDMLVTERSVRQAIERELRAHYNRQAYEARQWHQRMERIAGGKG